MTFLHPNKNRLGSLFIKTRKQSSVYQGLSDPSCHDDWMDLSKHPAATDPDNKTKFKSHCRWVEMTRDMQQPQVSINLCDCEFTLNARLQENTSVPITAILESIVP